MKLALFFIVSLFCSSLSAYTIDELYTRFPFCETVKFVEGSKPIKQNTLPTLPAKKIACSIQGYVWQENGLFKERPSFTFTIYINLESETTNGISKESYNNPMLQNFMEVSHLVDLNQYTLSVFLEEDQEIYGIRAISKDKYHPNLVWLIYGIWENVPRKKLILEREFLEMI